jgi:two-component system chemotaxis response regulator CheB
MFSALTERGAAASLEALSLGATDYFAKPSGTGGVAASLAVIRDELVPEIKALCRRDAGVPTGAAAAARPLPPQTGRVEAVAIGVSTGGPNALAEVFAGLPRDLPVPVTIVQHMPPMFTRMLAERLTSKGNMKVEEGVSGGELRSGHAWIAPGDFHMTVRRDGPAVRVEVNQDPPEHSCRPAADVLFRSMVRAYGPGVLAVVMTGMGQDGLRGCEAVREAGGQVIVQDEATSVVWGMPGYVAKAGLADRVVPLPLLATEIARRVRAGREPAR